MNMMPSKATFVRPDDQRAFGSPEDRRSSNQQMGSKLFFQAARLNKSLAELMEENARRVPCPHCELRISPGGLRRHIWCCHTELDDMFDADGNAVGL